MNRTMTFALILAACSALPAGAAPAIPKDCPKQFMAPLCKDTKVITNPLRPSALGKTWVGVEAPRVGPTSVAGTQYWQCLSVDNKAAWKLLANTCR